MYRGYIFFMTIFSFSYARLMCFYCATSEEPLISNSDKEIHHHYQISLCSEPLFVRVRTLDEKHGTLGYKAKHFQNSRGKSITLKDLKEYTITKLDIQSGTITKVKKKNSS